MNYKEHLYKNALKTIEFIYTYSKYNPNVDLYRSFDIINSVNDTQLNSKEWLVEKLLPFLSDYKLRDIIIIGSWYGITGMLLKNHLDENIKITLLNAKNAEKTLDHDWSPSVPEPIPGTGSG
mgnify:CR=1 FL=1